MRLACHEDFEAEGGLYWNPSFCDYPQFTRRAEQLAARFPSGRVLIVGCAWGFTVQHCLEQGLDAWGCDASLYALDRATEHLPAEVRARIFYGDITEATSMANVAQGRPFNAVVSEDMMPMLTIPEVKRAKQVLASLGGTVLHYVTPAPAEPHPSIVTPLDADGWRSLLEPQDVLITEAD